MLDKNKNRIIKTLNVAKMIKNIFTQNPSPTHWFDKEGYKNISDCVQTA
jgi:hypothetical protein